MYRVNQMLSWFQVVLNQPLEKISEKVSHEFYQVLSNCAGTQKMKTLQT